jgi:CubicO group peptidase (beta-lactamase class C family)
VIGTCDRRFAAVQEAFAENIATRGEVGAAVAVWVAGRRVVDLCGGWADTDRQEPWELDNLVNVFSVGKGMMATLVARLAGQGRLDVDAPVAEVWPEFAQAGKDDISLRLILSHQAGLPALRHKLHDGAMLDWPLMTSALAAEAPWWEPGTAHGYHVNTFGFLVGEVLRRITGQSPGVLLRDEITGPLLADVYLGLPKAEHTRVAVFQWPDGMAHPDPPADADDDQIMRFNTYWNPRGLSGAGFVNTEPWREAEMPSTNTHASARGVAEVYNALANDGIGDHVRIVDVDALAAATVEQVYGEDRILGRASRFGMGFQLPQPERPFGPNPRAFGHFGAGGSVGFADPDAEVGFGYVTNQLDSRWQNPRNRALIDAVFESLSG